MRFVLAVPLMGIVLVGAGCGNPDQTDGQLVTPTEDVVKSRAAIEQAVKDRPNMYAPAKGGQDSRR
ncbi:hypothetical protein [Paludisphaera soli]|uniref:hypothetical protein n=1 Tax=Paludisphaera soli TaxID=2712865 RepID=UPI0013ECA5FE|nr:hypothetical protein [Paludisphaera soli]